MDRKTHIRKESLKRRDEINSTLKKSADDLRTSGMIEFLKERSVESIWFYSSYKSEADTWDCIAYCLENKIMVALPKVTGTGMMEFYEIHSMNDLKKGAYGILEPKALAKPLDIRTQCPEAVVLPGAAFDQKGHRIGYGGGYYDRYFGNYLKCENHTRPILIAFCYKTQIYDEIPFEEHDICMDYLMTENGMIRIFP